MSPASVSTPATLPFAVRMPVTFTFSTQRTPRPRAPFT